MRPLIGGIAAALSLLVVGVVAAMTVQPVVVDLKMAGRQMSAPVRVENNGPNPLPVEIRIVETDFAADSVRASDRLSDDVIAFPPQALIPPGETQVFRLQYTGDPGADRSKHYYAEVAQLPVELPEGQSAIQILYNFQVMVNVASAVAGNPVLTIESAEIVQNEEGKYMAAFTVRNSSRNYGYLSSGSLAIRHTDAAGNETVRRTLASNDIQQMIGFGLVGPETTRRFISPVEVGSADGRVEATLTMPRAR
jgi:fimbrial chaperone protein